MTTLHHRIQTELIGEDWNDSGYEKHCRDLLRNDQHDKLPEFASQIEADLKGLLPRERETYLMETDPDEYLENIGYNRALEEITTAIERYCRGTE